MPETNDPVIIDFSDEMKAKPIIRQSVQNAINKLGSEILRLGGIVPSITAQLSIVKDDASNPLYSLKLLDYPDEPNPVERKFYHNDLVGHQDRLGVDLNRMLRELLSRRARRQAGVVNTTIGVSGNLLIQGR
ncbi:MAG: hypothetical protein ACJ8FY_12415 [Gemmataceae bacterium]